MWWCWALAIVSVGTLVGVGYYRYLRVVLKADYIKCRREVLQLRSILKASEADWIRMADYALQIDRQYRELGYKPEQGWLLHEVRRAALRHGYKLGHQFSHHIPVEIREERDARRKRRRRIRRVACRFAKAFSGIGRWFGSISLGAGMGSYSIFPTPFLDEEAARLDARRLAKDWEAVGGDMRNAAKKLGLPLWPKAKTVRINNKQSRA